MIEKSIVIILNIFIIKKYNFLRNRIIKLVQKNYYPKEMHK